MFSPFEAYWLLFGTLLVGTWSVLLAPHFVGVAARGQYTLAVFVLYVSGFITAVVTIVDRRENSGSSATESLSSTAIRISQVGTAIVALAAFAALLGVLTSRSAPPRQWLRPLLAYGFALALAALFAGDFNHNLLWFPGVILAASSCWATPNDVVVRHGRIILRSLVLVSVILYCAVPDYALLPNSTPRFFGLKQLAGLTSHPNGMGMIAAFALILELFGRRSRMSGIWFTVALVGLVLTQSRSGWLVALVGVLIWSSGRLGRTKTILLAPTAGIIGWSLVGEQISKTGLTGREDVWAVAWQVFLRYPVIGAGPGGLREAVLSNGVGSFGAQAHNQLLDTLAKTGLVGAVLLLSFFVRSLRRARHLAREGSGLTLALLAGLAARSLFESPIDGGFAVLLLVALLACQAVTPSGPTTSTRTALNAQVVPDDTYRPSE